MDMSLCGKGRFTDQLFEVNDVGKCMDTVSFWYGFVVTLIICRIFVAAQSWRSWVALHRRTKERAIKKKRYIFHRRLPIIPLLVTIASIVSVAAWILATTNSIFVRDQSSLILLALYMIIHLGLGNVTFIRYARLGQKLIPLVRSTNLKRTGTQMIGSSKTTEEENQPKKSSDPNRPERNENDIVVKFAEEDGVIDVEEHVIESRPDLDIPTQGRDSLDREAESDGNEYPKLTVTASGIYSFSDQQRHSLDVIDESGTNADTQVGTVLGVITLPLRVTFAAQTLVTIAAFICCWVRWEFVANAVTVICYLLACSRVLDGLLHFFQLKQAIQAVKNLIAQHATGEDVSDSLTALERQRRLTIFFDVVYAIFLFIAASTDQLLRHWYIFYAVDASVLAHNAALLVVHGREQHAKRAKAKKRQKAWEEKYAIVKLARQQRPKAVMSVPSSHHQNRSSGGKEVVVSSVVVDDAPTYDEAWEKGFRWRRWSTGNERKERKAFVIEFKRWHQDQEMNKQVSDHPQPIVHGHFGLVPHVSQIPT